MVVVYVKCNIAVYVVHIVVFVFLLVKLFGWYKMKKMMHCFLFHLKMSHNLHFSLFALAIIICARNK